MTFKKVDPLFVFDLSNPKEPVLQGELKIPGYSDYLQFINDQTVIGFGKDALDAGQSEKDHRGMDFAWYQGLKLALFNISNMKKPLELSNVILGDRGSESTALYDHRAFLFDQRNQLIVIPATIAKIDPQTCNRDQKLQPCSGLPVSHGAQVFAIKEGKKLEYIKEISHGQIEPLYSSYYTSANEIIRSYILENTLVTISTGKIMVHEIATMNELQSLKL